MNEGEWGAHILESHRKSNCQTSSHIAAKWNIMNAFEKKISNPQKLPDHQTGTMWYRFCRWTWKFLAVYKYKSHCYALLHLSDKFHQILRQHYCTSERLVSIFDAVVCASHKRNNKINLATSNTNYLSIGDYTYIRRSLTLPYSDVFHLKFISFHS